jgi:hypothetical protein
MNLAYRRLSLCTALLLAACPDNGNMTSAGPDTTTGDTSTTTITPTTTTPTTTTMSSDPTTGDTTTTTTEGSSGGSTAEGSTTGVQPGACSTITDKNTCGLTSNCKWGSVVSYSHGTKGCQGNLKEFCVPKDIDPMISSFWKDNNGDIEVLQFNFLPDDLGPDWKACDCDGPLACLCTGATLDCPDLLDGFCGGITDMDGCNNATASMANVCNWFRVRPTGPADASCGDKPQQYVCLNATGVGTTTCDNIKLPYPQCTLPENPVYWHDDGGNVEVTKSCGPEPVGWTKCLADDPNQPEDCKCLCL